jgi:hypothetical protein
MEPMPFGFLDGETEAEPIKTLPAARALLRTKSADARLELKFYGILLLLFVLFGVGLFFFFAYQAFGGVGLLVGGSVFVAGLWIFATFISHF